MIARIETLFLNGQSLATRRNLYLEDISTVADNILLWRQHRKRNGWLEGSFEDFCCDIVLLEKLVKPV